MHFLFGLIFFAAITSFAFYKLPQKVWMAALATLLAIYNLLHLLSWPTLLILDILFVGLVVLLRVTSLRLQFITHPLLLQIRRNLPPMSKTEREALNAGDVWWEKELFCGNPNWDTLLKMSKPTLSQEEQSFLDKQVDELCSQLNDWEITQKYKDLPPSVWEYIKKEKFLGLVIPKEYGGLGFSALAHSTIVTKIATRSLSAAIDVMVPNSLGPGELLVHYGTQEQKDYYLPRLARGDEIPCFGLTEPNAGSDAASIHATGTVCKGLHEGKEIVGLKLSWDKRYITLAPIATVLGLAVKVYDPEHLIGKTENIGITLCLIPTNHPGVNVGLRHYPLGMAFMNGPTTGKNVFIPLDWIIGGKENLGQGWRMLMECLSIGRAISLPAVSTATAHVCFSTTGAYSKIRQQFKLPIGAFEGVGLKLAEVGANCYLLEAARLMTVSAVDMNIKPTVASAIAKYHLTEISRQVMNDAMDIHAGRGIQMGPRNYLASGYEAIPIAITVEGANILTRNLIIFGQGAMRCHPYLREEMDIANAEPTPNTLEKFDKILWSHAGYTLNNAARAFMLSLPCPSTLTSTDPLKKYLRKLSRFSAALALTSDITMLILGGNLKRKEALSARLGDVLSELYLSSAILRYYHNEGSLPEALPYLEFSLQSALFRLQNALIEFLDNFPVRSVGIILKLWLFPLGKPCKKPSDKLAISIAKHMMQPSKIREALSRHCYIGKSKNDPIFRIEYAFQAVIAAESAVKKLNLALKKGELSKVHHYHDILEDAVAQKIISDEDAKRLLRAHEATEDAIQVDSFSPDYFTFKGE